MASVSNSSWTFKKLRAEHEPSCVGADPTQSLKPSPVYATNWFWGLVAVGAVATTGLTVIILAATGVFAGNTSAKSPPPQLSLPPPPPLSPDPLIDGAIVAANSPPSAPPSLPPPPPPPPPPSPPPPSPPPPSSPPPPTKPPPPVAPTLANSLLLFNAPDYNQAWFYDSAITMRALCTPTAFGAQLDALHHDGLMPELPLGFPYTAPGTTMPLTTGSLGFAYEYTLPAGGMYVHASSWPGSFQAAFGWYMNTNLQGATDVVGMSPPSGGTLMASAITGGMQFYARTPMGPTEAGYAYHKSPGVTGGRLPPQLNAANSNLDPTQTHEALKHSIAGQRPVVAFFDSWSVVSTGIVVDDITLAWMGAWASSSSVAEHETYVQSAEAPEAAVGHTVLAVGSFEYNGCEWLATQDNSPVTPTRFIALPFLSPCTSLAGATGTPPAGARAAFDALLATFHVMAPP